MYVLVLLSRASTTIVFSYFYSTFKKIAQQVMNIACAPLFASTNPWNNVIQIQYRSYFRTSLF